MSVMPMMAFIGVRISWLILARNSDFSHAGDLRPSGVDVRRTSFRIGFQDADWRGGAEGPEPLLAGLQLRRPDDDGSLGAFVGVLEFRSLPGNVPHLAEAL